MTNAFLIAFCVLRISEVGHEMQNDLGLGTFSRTIVVYLGAAIPPRSSFGADFFIFSCWVKIRYYRALEEATFVERQRRRLLAQKLQILARQLR
jgi:hypothetical protein